MIPWVQVYSNLPLHPKVSRLADALRLPGGVVNPNVVAIGILVSLWTWAIQNAYDGDLSGCNARTISDACHWKRKPEVLLNALKETGWIDDDMKIHDWEEYAMLLIEQETNKREKTKERVRRYRDRKTGTV